MHNTEIRSSVSNQLHNIIPRVFLNLQVIKLVLY